MKTILFALTAFCALSFQQTALAASSEWHDLQGAALRLVTEDTPDENGMLRGALEIELKPGWKTYWRDPGPAGVAPTVAISIDGKAAELEIDFPTPLRIDDGYSLWAGYKEPVRLAINIQVPSDVSNPGHLVANTFLGLCETICIPAQVDFSLHLASNINNLSNQRIIDTAFANIPEKAPENTLTIQEDKPDSITFQAASSVSNNILDLFIAGTDDLVLGTPELIESNENTAIFNVPVVYRTQNLSNQILAYTLVTDNQALSGKIALP